MSVPSILTVEALTVRAKGKLVLKDIGFAIPAIGMTAVMGPVGTGKSTLLKWVCARTDPAVYEADVDQATYFGAPLTRRHRPPLYAQRQAQSLEQMKVQLDVMLASNPAMICLDEPAADLPPAEREAVMERLGRIAQSRALLVVSHNQADMRRHSDHVMLLAGGRVQEFTPTRQFFEDPDTEAGRQFVGSGWVVTAGVETPNHHLSHDLRGSDFDVGIEPAGADGRLRAVVAGRLYAYDAPGNPKLLLADIGEMRARGVSVAVGHVDRLGLAGVLLESAGIEVLDAGGAPDAPAFAEVRARCRRTEALRGDGAAVLWAASSPSGSAAVAVQLIHMGVPADRAASIAAQLRGRTALPPAEEQLLWDFELSGDLALDGADPAAFRPETPDIGWIERQVAGRDPVDEFSVTRAVQ